MRNNMTYIQIPGAVLYNCVDIQYLCCVSTNIRTRVPASSESILSLNVSPITEANGNTGVLGAHAIGLEVAGS